MSETPQGYTNLPGYYVQSSTPQTPNLGLTLTGVDPIVAYNFVLIDTASGGSASVSVNGSLVTNPNFNGTTPAAPASNTNVTFQVNGSSVSAYVPTGTPASPTTSVQFNNSGAFGGDAALEWDNTNKKLNISGTGTAATNGLYITGTTSGASVIEIHNTFAVGLTAYTHSDTAFRGPQLNGFRSRGTQASPTTVQTNDILAYYQAFGYDGSTYAFAGSFELFAAETWSGTAHGSYIDMFVVPPTTIGSVRVMRLTDTNISISQSNLIFTSDNSKDLGASGATRPRTGYFGTSVLSPLFNAATGFQIAGAATSGNVLRGNGTNFVSAVLQPGDLQETVNAQSGTTYTILDTDRGKLVSFTNASPIAVTLPQAGAASAFLSGWFVDINNEGAGLVTITPTTSTIDGLASSSVAQFQGYRIISNGTNYLVVRGVPVFAAKSANTVFAGPTSGGAAIPAFRLLVAADYVVMVGDSGSGGTQGAVPAPAAGDSAASKFLSAGGTWAVPSVPASSVRWDQITNANGNLLLANAGFTTTFNQTSAVAWTWGNTTPTIAPALTLTQVTVSGGSTTYTGTITGGGTNAYAGASVTFAGFVNGGNNVAAQTITSSTATTLVVATTTQTNETHAGTAVSSAVVNSPTHVFSTTFEGASNAPGTDTWTIQNVIGSLVANPTSALTFTHAGSTGNAAVLFPAGTATAPSVTVRQITQGMSASTTSILNLCCGAQNGSIQIGDTTSAKLQFTSAASPTIQPVQAGNNLTIQSSIGSQNTVGMVITSSANFTATANNQGHIQVSGIFAPTSGTCNYFGILSTPTINQTGGANGTLRILAAYPQNTAVVGTQYLLALGTTTAAGIAGTLTDQFLINNSGVIANYASTATVGQGVPSQIVTVDLTAQSAAIAATNLTASAPRTGMYRISMSATITTAATTSSVLGGTNGFQIIFTSPTDSVAKTTVAGNSITTAANTTATAIADTITAYCKTGTAIQYSFDYTSVGVTAMSYEIHLRLEAL